MNAIVVTLAPERERIRLLVTRGDRDLVKAILPPWHLAHPRAAATLLEGLALWHQQTLSVVLLADASDTSSSARALTDALGFGERTLHYDVALACRWDRQQRRRQRIEGVARFDDLRHERLEVVR
ncbi:MAG: hypothetical protein AAB268_03635 [Elusimicrobiota bacterium]